MPCLHGLKTTLWVVFFCATQAYAGEMHSALPTHFPGTTLELQDGDVILNDGLGLVSALNREFGYPTGPYTHVSIYVEFPGEGGKVVGYTDDGVKISPPERILAQNFRLALVRPLARPAAGALASAFKQLSKQSLQFDYDMRRSEAGGNSTYCVDFVAQLFQLTDPLAGDLFPQNLRPSDFWSDWVQTHLGLDLSPIVSPNAFMHNPRFQALAEYESENPRMQVNNWIRQTVMQKLKAFIRNDQLDVAPPKLGSTLALFAAKKGLMDGVVLAKMPESRQRVFITVYEFMITVEERVKRTMRLNDDQDWHEESVSELTAAVSEALRDDFFVAEQRQR